MVRRGPFYRRRPFPFRKPTNRTRDVRYVDPNVSVVHLETPTQVLPTSESNGKGGAVEEPVHTPETENVDITFKDISNDYTNIRIEAHENQQPSLPMIHIIGICCLVVCTLSLVILTALLVSRSILRIRADRRRRKCGGGSGNGEDMEKLPEIVPVPSVYFATNGITGGLVGGREKPPSYQPSHASSFIYIPRDAHIVQS